MKFCCFIITVLHIHTRSSVMFLKYMINFFLIRVYYIFLQVIAIHFFLYLLRTGSFLVLVRRANIRFAPTVVLLIGLISVFAQGIIVPYLVHTPYLNADSSQSQRVSYFSSIPYPMILIYN